MNFPLAILITLAPFPSANAQQTWTVDDTGPADFPDIAPAIEVARAGDTILVQPGSYSGFELVQKGIAIVGTGPDVEVIGGVVIEELPALQDALLARLDIRGFGELALDVSSCAGSVRILECDMEAVYSFESSFEEPGMRARNSSDVTVVSSSMLGERGDTYMDSCPGEGLLCMDSRVALHGCSLMGGSGDGIAAQVGGSGLSVQGTSEVLVARSQARGGRGGSGRDCDCDCFPTDGADGGPGIRVVAPASVWVIDSVATGGDPGAGGQDWCGGGGFEGEDGLPGEDILGPVNHLSPLGVTLELSPLGCSQTTVRVLGPAGLSARLLLDARTEWHLEPDRWGVSVLPDTAAIFAELGPIPATGVLEAVIDLPVGSPGSAVRWSTLQVVVDTPQGEQLGNGITTVVLGAETTAYCTSAPNSVSPSGALLDIAGNGSLQSNELELLVSDLPQTTVGVLFFGSQEAQAPFQDGFLCVTDTVARVGSPIHSGLGSLQQPIDLAPFLSVPGAVRIEPGDTRYFQFWYRDPLGPGGTGSNMTQGVAVSFCP